jgi:iron complex outermembrane receptor protein
MKPSIQNPNRRPSLTPVAHALLALGLATPLALHAQSAATVAQAVETVVVTGHTSQGLKAADAAPSQGSLTARSAQSVIDDAFIRNFTTPLADYTQVVANSPGAFSYSPNGVGLGDTKITMRGLSDSNMVYTFDGIPFNDTNGVSHHSWAYFPSQFLGGVVVDRGPGTAASIGQATFGGSVFLQSRVLEEDRRTSVMATLGTWNTKVLGLEHNTGNFGADGQSRLLVNVQEMKSDGYQTFNQQDRQTLSAKLQTPLGSKTVLTLFGSYLNLKNNTPNVKGVTRANYDAGHPEILLSGDISKPDYFGFNFYNLYTNFVYAGVSSDLGGGWKLEDKLYRYQYHNKQNYNSATAIAVNSATDKLNSYVTTGNTLRVTQESALGTLRTGLWIDRADSYRYQIPADPRTWVDQSAPNFSERYVTTTTQPYVEFEFKLGDALKVTPGLKTASYKQDFVHLQDNGGAVGTLGGTYNKTTGVITGGAPSLANSVRYSDVMPALDVHYQLQPKWSAYAQWAVGDQIPSTSVFDVKDAKVSPAPKATKTTTSQVGTVWVSDRLTLAADLYHTKLDGAYTALAPDAAGNVAYVLSGTQVSQGVEAEGTWSLGQGFSLYANATLASLKYANGQWVAGAPKDTETLALNYVQGAWSANVSANRVGRVFGDDKAGVHQQFVMDPVVLTNLLVNYTVKSPVAFAKQAKLQLGVNNLLNRHSIVGIASPVAGSSSAKPNAGDVLTVLPARSITLTATLDF